MPPTVRPRRYRAVWVTEVGRVEGGGRWASFFERQDKAMILDCERVD